MSTITPSATAATEISPLLSTFAADNFMSEMVTIFAEELPAQASRLQSSFAAGDWDALRRSAHHLRATASNCGFDGLVPYAARLERTLFTRNSPHDVQQSLDLLLAQCARVSAGRQC